MLLQLWLDQRSALRFVLSSPRVLVPALVRWVERFGGGLGSPVKPFFMLALSLSPSQMGMLSTVSVVFALIPAPFYGFVQDRFGTYFPIIVASITCGLGCTLEGLATGFSSLVAARIFQGFGGDNLPSVINAHLSTCAPPSKRALVLSAFSFQCQLLRLGGQLFYVPWDSMLRALALGRMLRFRITLSVCSFFCWFGVVALLVAGRHLRQPQSAVGPIDMADDDGEQRSAVITSSKEGKGGHAAAAASAADPGDAAAAAATADLSVGAAVGRIVPCVLLLTIVTCYESLLLTIWPLWLHEHYGWSEQQYASLIFASTVGQAAAVGLYPRLHACAGDSLSVLVVACTLGGGAMAALALTPRGLADGHVALMLLANGCVAALGPAVMALASTLVPSAYLGRLFATMNMCNALGRSVAGMVGTRLYELSVALPPPGAADGGGGSLVAAQPPAVAAWLAALGPLARGGALPTTLLAPLLLGVAAVVHATTTLAKRGGRRTELV